MNSNAYFAGKFGNCPYCYGTSIFFTVFFLGLLFLAYLSDAPPYIQLGLLGICIVFFSWTLLHIIFFLARMHATVKPLLLAPVKEIRHLLKLAYIFSISSVLLVLKAPGKSSR